VGSSGVGRGISGNAFYKNPASAVYGMEKGSTVNRTPLVAKFRITI